MAPTTVTTIVLILFALGLFALTAYAWLGSWDLMLPRRTLVTDEDEIETAVRQLRRSIEAHERGQR